MDINNNIVNLGSQDHDVAVSIANNLRIQNAREIAKELYELGAISKEAYISKLKDMFKHI